MTKIFPAPTPLDRGVHAVGCELIHPDARLPTKTDGNIGWDFYVVEDEAFNVNSYQLRPGERKLFHTGVKMQLPAGVHMLLWDRSGLSAKSGVHRLAGVIDSSYRGEVRVCLVNLGDKTVQVRSGDRIIQGILQEEVPAMFVETDSVDETLRGDQGFGSTGA